jgi:hypothetical protein
LCWQMLNSQKLVCRDASIIVVARLQVVVSDAVQTATAPTELRATASDSIAVRRPASPSLAIAPLCPVLNSRVARTIDCGHRRAADHNCAESIVQTIPLWQPWRCCSRSSRSNLYWQILQPQKIGCRDASISVVARLQVVSDDVQTATAPTELRATASDSIAVRRPASPSLAITPLRPVFTCSFALAIDCVAFAVRPIIIALRLSFNLCILGTKRCCSRSSRSILFWQMLNPQKTVCRDASISVVAPLQVVSDKVQTATAPTELRATASDSIAVRRLNFFCYFYVNWFVYMIKLVLCV